MPEGLLGATGTVTGAVHDNPDRPPDPTADAPRGWAWQRKEKRWAPRQRGPILWTDNGDDGGRTAGRVPDGAAGDLPGGTESGAQRDPDPSWLRKQDGDAARASEHRQTIEDIDPEIVGDIAGFAGLVGAPLLAILQQADPYCGTALAQSFEGIIDACLPLICRSKKITDYFTGDKNDWLLWGKLALAMRPFAQAVIEHHVLRTVQVQRDERGNVYVLRGRQQDQHGDHLTPPAQPEYAA